MKSKIGPTSSPSKRKLRLRDSTRLAKSRGKKLPLNSQVQPVDLSSLQMPIDSTSSDSDDVPLSQRFQFQRRSEASSSGVETPFQIVSPLVSSIPSPSRDVCNEEALSEEEARLVAKSEALLPSVKALVDVKAREEATGDDSVPPVENEGESLNVPLNIAAPESVVSSDDGGREEFLSAEEDDVGVSSGVVVSEGVAPSAGEGDDGGEHDSGVVASEGVVPSAGEGVDVGEHVCAAVPSNSGADTAEEELNVLDVTEELNVATAPVSPAGAEAAEEEAPESSVGCIVLPPVFDRAEDEVLDDGAATPMGVSGEGVPTPTEEPFSFPTVADAVTEPIVDSAPSVSRDFSAPKRHKKALASKRTSAAAGVFSAGVATPTITPSGDPAPSVVAPPGARKSKKRPRSPDDSFPVEAFSSTFLTKEAQGRLSTIDQRIFLNERPIDMNVYSMKTELIQLFTNLQLIVSVSPFSGFVPSVIHEFYCNLESSVFDPASPHFEHVFVRGKYRPFSAKEINKALGITHSEFPALTAGLDQIVHTLTDGVRSRWPLKKDIPSSNLAGWFSLLHKIALFNWMPSSHSTGIKKSLAKLLFCIGTGVRVNMGKIIFDQLKPFASLKVNSSSLIFPNIIYKVLCASDKAFLREKGKVVSDSVLRPSSKILKRLSGRSISYFASGPGSRSASVPEVPEEVSAPSVVTPMDAASLRTLHLTIRRLERLEPLLLQFREWVDEVTMYVHGSLGDLNALAAAHAPRPPPEI